MIKHLIFAGLMALATVSVQAESKSIYLSPTGSDQHTGSLTRPVATLDRAIALAQQTPGSDTVFIRTASGVYPLPHTVVVQQNDRPIVVEGDAADKPQFSGGIAIDGWQPWERGIWRTRVPATERYGVRFEQLFVDGKRATPAKSPNTGYYYVKGVNETVLYTGKGRSPEFAAQQIVVEPSEIEPLNSLTIPEMEQVRFMFYHKWDVTRKGVAYAAPDSGYIYTAGEGMKSWNPIRKGDRYTLFNLLAALDDVGEWFLSRDGWLYYKPLPGQDMRKTTCVAPTLEKLLVLSGTEDKPVKNISFRNIGFQHTSYQMPIGGNEPMQAASATPAAIEADYASQIRFDNCEVSHTGTYAMWIRRECFDVTIDHCLITDLGAGGIKIGETAIRDNNRPVTARIKVNNSIIQHAGYVFPCGVGLSIFQASDNEVTHNEISDIRYSGVSIGWKWGYNDQPYWSTVLLPNGKEESKLTGIPSPAVRNKVNFNHIHHIGWAELSDMGAVYTLGVSPGTEVCNNVIHDIHSYDYGGWGLYTDEGSTGILMSNNLVYRCKSGAFHQHYGRENRIENNILAFSHYQSLQFTRVEAHTSFYFRRNIILQNQGKTIAGPWKKSTAEMDYNCYWDLRDKPIDFAGETFKVWQQTKDKHSIVANPMFKDPLADDFTFTSLKTAKRIGFKPFDPAKAGVYGSKEWIEQAKLAPEIIQQFREAAEKNVAKDK